MSSVRRIVAFTATATVVYWIVTGVGAVVSPPASTAQLRHQFPGLIIGAAVAYYLVYRGGYTGLRDRFG